MTVYFNCVLNPRFVICRQSFEKVLLFMTDSNEAVDVDHPEEPNVEYTEVLHPQTDPTRGKEQSTFNSFDLLLLICPLIRVNSFPVRTKTTLFVSLNLSVVH